MLGNAIWYIAHFDIMLLILLLSLLIMEWFYGWDLIHASVIRSYFSYECDILIAETYEKSPTHMMCSILFCVCKHPHDPKSGASLALTRSWAATISIYTTRHQDHGSRYVFSYLDYLLLMHKSRSLGLYMFKTFFLHVTNGIRALGFWSMHYSIFNG